MSNQGNYRRTVAGSVGAGMGAIFNGSGRTYYILEHKTQSQFHNIGESQKIIIDQIELGRASSCQVRWEDTPQFEMVSRRHAAIVRDGNNWELVHLSTSNPTLVNGRPIQGHYYLQSGDEIQLAANGPRMGFIVPQGKQAMTSSIRLTERMNLFRQQALAPYKKALWAMGILLLLVIIGFGGWNYKLTQDNNKLMAQATELIQQSADLDKQISQLEDQIKANPENAELKKQVEELKQQKQQVQTRYTTVYRDNPALQQELAALKAKMEATNDNEGDEDEDNVPDKKDDTNVVAVNEPNNNVSSSSDDGVSDNIENYYDDIYTLKVDKIEIEYEGHKAEPSNIATSEVVVGNAFYADGKLITSRSNLEPWIYGTDSWRHKLGEYDAIGAKIIITYSAYSTRGAGHALRFKNTDFNLEPLREYDKLELWTVTKEFRKTWIGLGFVWVSKEMKTKNFYIRRLTEESFGACGLAMSADGGLPTDMSKASNLTGSDQVTIAGFNGKPDIHKLSRSIKYHSSTASRTSEFRLITLQGNYSNLGYTGSPVFFKDKDGFKVVGVNLGNFENETYVSRINHIN